MYHNIKTTFTSMVQPGHYNSGRTVLGQPFYIANRHGSFMRVMWAVCQCDTCHEVAVARVSGLELSRCPCRRRCPGAVKHAKTGSPLHRRWIGMRSRCSTDNPRYGGRGISVCSDWDDFEVFESWSLENGFRTDLQLDRIDVDGNYEPSNCRWVTPTENARNTSRTRFVTAFGEQKAMSEWGLDPRCIVTTVTVSARMERGWTAEAAMTTPSPTSSRRPVRKPSSRIGCDCVGYA